MQIRNLDHLNMTVRDFEESAAWYERIFGFEVVERKEMDGLPWGVLRCGETMLCLYERQDHTFLNRFQLRERGLHGMAHFALRIDNRQEWMEVMEREGIEVNYDGEVDWPHSRSWYISDPTGYEIEVVLWDHGPDFAGV